MAYTDYMGLNVWCTRKAVKHNHSFTTVTIVVLCAIPQIAKLMGPTWVLSAPDEPHVGPINITIRDYFITDSAAMGSDSKYHGIN